MLITWRLSPVTTLEERKMQRGKSCKDLLHPFRVYFCIFSTRFECIFASSQLVLSVFLQLLNSFRVYFCIFPTRFECIFASSQLISSVFLHLPNLFRVEFSSTGAKQPSRYKLRANREDRKVTQITPLECSFTSSPLHSSVVLHLLHSFWV